MNTLKSLLILLLVPLSARAIEPFPEETLIKIITEEHDPRPLIKPLQVYPVAREYEIITTRIDAKGQRSENKAMAKEKWVKGRYIVSESQHGNPDFEFFMIVDFDEQHGVYRKHIILKKSRELVGFQIGTGIENTRSIAWLQLPMSEQENSFHSLSTETHTEKTTTWKATNFHDGKYVGTGNGVATVTK